MSLSRIAIILLGVYLIILALEEGLSKGWTLAFGIAVVALVLLDGRVALPAAPPRRVE